jgi:hypothetical protein
LGDGSVEFFVLFYYTVFVQPPLDILAALRSEFSCGHGVGKHLTDGLRQGRWRAIGN